MKTKTKRNWLGLKRCRGGLASAPCVHEKIYIGDQLLQFQRPKQELVAHDADQTRHISLSSVAGPYEQTKEGAVRGCEAIALVNTSLNYYPLTSIFLPYYVLLGIYWRLEKVRPHAEVSQPITDADSLEAYLRVDFEHFLEDEGRLNWEVRKEIYEEDGPQGRNYPQQTIDRFIASNIHYPPVDYKRVNLNGHTWLRYIWAPASKRRGGGPDGIWRGLVYCYPLSPGHILSVTFNFTDAANGDYSKWIDQVVADIETLMSTVTLEPVRPPELGIKIIDNMNCCGEFMRGNN